MKKQCKRVLTAALVLCLSAGLMFPVTASAAGTPIFAAGNAHTLAVKNDGTVWAWGANTSGKLGDGTRTERYAPVQVKGLDGAGFLTGVAAVAAGYGHSMALKNDGTLWAWGFNLYGQLGDGTSGNIVGVDKRTPVQVPGMTGVTAIAADVEGSMALKSDGTVWAWGENNCGQLGDGTTTDKSSPAQVPGLTDVTAIAISWYHALAVKSDGTVWAWGQNTFGQLGDGTTTDKSSPVQVPGLTGVTAVAAGWYHTYALKSDGTVWAWGQNNCGSLGDGTFTNSSSPVQVTGLSGVTAIAANNSCCFALKSDGTVWAWGGNDHGQLGIGDSSVYMQNSPVQVSGLTGVTAIAAGYSHALALKNDGTVWAWGYNTNGRLGDGTFTDRFAPIQVKGTNGTDWFNVKQTGTPRGVFGTKPKYNQWYHYLLFFLCFGWIWMWY